MIFAEDAKALIRDRLKELCPDIEFEVGWKNDAVTVDVPGVDVPQVPIGDVGIEMGDWRAIDRRLRALCLQAGLLGADASEQADGYSTGTISEDHE